MFLQFCFLQYFSKIFSKTHQNTPLFKFSWLSMPPNPPSKRVASPRAASASPHANIPPLFQKYFEPSQNEILDTPLYLI